MTLEMSLRVHMVSTVIAYEFKITLKDLTNFIDAYQNHFSRLGDFTY